MIFVCLIGVLIGDLFAFFIGYFSGVKLLNNKFIKKIISENNKNKILADGFTLFSILNSQLL
jgi:membrane protein DedA with SNARE-associated domain